MNYKQKQEANKRLKESFQRTYPEGCCKIVGTVSKEHEVTKAEVFHWLKAQGFETWSEGHLKDGSRFDILAIKNDFGVICEILHTETKKRYQAKLNKSYGDFIVIPISTKEWEYDKFCI